MRGEFTSELLGQLVDERRKEDFALVAQVVHSIESLVQCRLVDFDIFLHGGKGHLETAIHAGQEEVGPIVKGAELFEVLGVDGRTR